MKDLTKFYNDIIDIFEKNELEDMFDLYTEHEAFYITKGYITSLKDNLILSEEEANRLFWQITKVIIDPNNIYILHTCRNINYED